MVTTRPGIALGVLHADCAPVLFADREARVVAAAHAGWRGALDGVLEATLGEMQRQASATLFNLGAKKAFVALCSRLRARLVQARARNQEIHDMLQASFRQLNSEYGFALTLPRLPSLERCDRELDLIERSYVQYLGLSQALRLAEPRFMEQFRRMLLSKLRMAFENASGEVELWHKSASNQVDSQLRERRRGFKRRRDGLERIQAAAGDLDHRIGDLESQDARWQHLTGRVRGFTQALSDAATASSPPAGGDSPSRTAPSLLLVPPRSAAG